MLATLCESQKFDDARMTKSTHDLNFFEDIGSLSKQNRQHNQHRSCISMYNQLRTRINAIFEENGVSNCSKPEIENEGCEKEK